MLDWSNRARVHPRASRLLLLVILLLALVVRLYQLDVQSFWDDEALSVLHVNVPLGDLLLGLPSDHTPGYFLLLHYWIPLAGDVDFSIRYFSVLWGVLSVALMYALGRRITRASRSVEASTRVGLFAAFLLALNPFALYYSQEARMYSQVVALGIATLYWFIRAYEQPTRRAYGNAHMLALAAALYTHYYALALPFAEGAFLLLEPNGRTRVMLARWFRSLFGVGLLFIPWLPFMFFLVLRGSWQRAVDPLTYPAQIWAIFLAGTTMPNDAMPALFVASALLLITGIYSARRMWQGRLLVITLIVPFVVMLAALTLRGQGPYPRYLIVLLPAFILLVALGIEQFRRAGRPLVVLPLALWMLVAILSLQNYWFDPHYSRPGWSLAARYVSANERPGDVILVDGGDPSLEFARYFRGRAKFSEVQDFKATAPMTRVDSALSRVTAGAARVWLVAISEHPERVLEWLNLRGYQGDYQEFAGVYVFPYVLSAQLSSPRAAEHLEKQIDVNLVSYQLGAARAGELLPLVLKWQNGAENLDTNFQVSLRLVDAAGNLIVALDRAPRAGFHPTTHWQPGEVVEDRYALALPATLRAGDYQLRVLLYDPADNKPPLEALLGTVHIDAVASANQ